MCIRDRYADIVYNGQWFTPLREALDAFADSLEKTVTGDVGQGTELDGLEEKAKKTGASKLYILDVYKRQGPCCTSPVRMAASSISRTSTWQIPSRRGSSRARSWSCP